MRAILLRRRWRGDGSGLLGVAAAQLVGSGPLLVGPGVGPLAGGEVVLEGLDDAVDEVAVGRAVPADPEARVAVEALALEHGRLVVPMPMPMPMPMNTNTDSTVVAAAAGLRLFGWFLLGGGRGGIRASVGGGFERPREHVGEDLAVLEGKDRGEGENGSWKKAEHGENHGF